MEHLVHILKNVLLKSFNVGETYTKPILSFNTCFEFIISNFNKKTMES